MFGNKAEYSYKNGVLVVQTNPEQPITRQFITPGGLLPHILDHIGGLIEDIRRIRLQRDSDFAFLNARCTDLQNEVDALRNSLVKAAKTKKKSSKKKK